MIPSTALDHLQEDTPVIQRRHIHQVPVRGAVYGHLDCGKTSYPQSYQHPNPAGSMKQSDCKLIYPTL